MMVVAEAYTQLMTDPAHLGFEVTLTIIQDVLIGLVLWPLIKRLVRRHDRGTHKIQVQREMDCDCIGPSHYGDCPLKATEAPY